MVYGSHQSKEDPFGTETTNLGYVSPVPGVRLLEGSLPLRERNPQWSSVAFGEEPFASWDSQSPKRTKVLWPGHGMRSRWPVHSDRARQRSSSA